MVVCVQVDPLVKTQKVRRKDRNDGKTREKT
jgi:hypothetical protein